MRFRLTLVAVTAAATALLAPPMAGAGSLFENDYEGRIEADPFTYFGFDTVRRDGKLKVARVTIWARFHCTNGSSVDLAARANGKLKVEDRRFAGTLRGELAVARGDKPHVKLRLRGKLGKRGRAGGTVDATARLLMAAEMRGPSGEEVRCYTGGLDWKAKRGADITPPLR